jgi:hypothetical protein
MSVSIPSPLIEFILLGPADDRRQLQDSPILGDVWVEFGKTPAAPLDLLISPYKTQHAGSVAADVAKGLGDAGDDARIAYLQGLVVAHLTFEQVLKVVVPKTKWWIDKWTQDADKTKSRQEAAGKPTYRHEITRRYDDKEKSADLNDILSRSIKSAGDWHKKTDTRRTLELTPLDRFAALAGFILWASKHDPQMQPNSSSADDLITYILERMAEEVGEIVEAFKALSQVMINDSTWKDVKDRKAEPSVYLISLNRAALPALIKSVPAVKADAATTLFKINCRDIAWAVLDSGIDGDHPAFRQTTGKGSRVKRSFDFKDFRRIVSLSNAKDMMRKKNIYEHLMTEERLEALLDPPKKPDEDLKKLAEVAINRGPIHWELVEKFVEIKPGAKPATHHGTHVAGIIGANGKLAKRLVGREDEPNAEGGDFGDGMCPDISLYDFRVLGLDLKDTEFSIIAALQFIRYLNDRDNFFTIHGANLSMSIPHDVRNFACGRTPICNECERVVDSGVVVVTAAGNHGYKSFQTKEGAYESYAAFSITDPGNAEGVITVGATHRYWPHTYGVSFFSSRGPTGDGRLKPDLVAPGERIRAPFPGGHDRGGEWGDLDGTSMAAPHVSGAAAMLLARYSELIGQPRRIKRILCESATNLGRERSFQGHGMLDVLRAFQSI